jgi:hypothetical protein
LIDHKKENKFFSNHEDSYKACSGKISNTKEGKEIGTEGR